VEEILSSLQKNLLSDDVTGKLDEIVRRVDHVLAKEIFQPCNIKR